MHPADVAQFVAESVGRLRDVLAANPEIVVRDVELRDASDLFIPYTAEIRDSAPTERLRIAQAPGLETALLRNVPIIGSARPVNRILYLSCSNFDGDPPFVDLLDEDEQKLRPDHWPKDPDGQGIVHGHPLFGPGPFFCRPGTRQFHTHPQHEDEPWDRFREVTPLDQIVVELLRDLTSRWILR
jgi:hypothetical protein